jgi:hypothetical protein
MADTLILEGTTSLEMSARGTGSDVRSWARGEVGRRGARLFINNIAEPGTVDTIINLHRGNVGIGTADPIAKLALAVEGNVQGLMMVVRNTNEFGSGVTIETFGSGHGLFAGAQASVGIQGASVGSAGVNGRSVSGPGVRGDSRFGAGVAAATTEGRNVIEGRHGDALVFVVRRNGAVLADGPFGGPADFAEMLPVSGPVSSYQPGDVLVIGDDGQLTHSTAPNAATLAGVYSTDPGFVGDMRIRARGLEAADDGATADTAGWIPVAIVGVVPVKVSDEGGAIRPGDLLTTSATPAHAMKATPVLVGGTPIYPTGGSWARRSNRCHPGRGRSRCC